MSKILTLIALTILGVGCGPTDPNFITNNYYRNTYNVTQLQMQCAGMNEGDVIELNYIEESNLTIKDGNCVLRFGGNDEL